MPVEGNRFHFWKYVVKSFLAQQVCFALGVLYLSGVSHGMWRTNKVKFLLIHWLSLIVLVYGMRVENLFLSVIGGIFFFGWWCVTSTVWLHFVFENYSMHWDGLSAREQKNLIEPRRWESSGGSLRW